MDLIAFTNWIKCCLLIVLISSCLPVWAQHKVEATQQFTIEGLVDKPATINFSAIKKFPQSDLGEVLVRNHRGEEKITAKGVKGVLLRQILDSSVHIATRKPKELSEMYLVLTASDGYKNVYSWNELFNTTVGEHVYIVTETDGKKIEDMDGAILVISTADQHAGTRHFKGLQKIEIKKVD